MTYNDLQSRFTVKGFSNDLYGLRTDLQNLKIPQVRTLFSAPEAVRFRILPQEPLKKK